MLIPLKPSRLSAGIGFALGFLGLVCLPLITHAITVGPTKLQLSVNPGKSVSGTLYIKNDSGSQTQTFYPSIQKFTVNEAGQKVFSDEQSDIVAWMHLPASVTLAPGVDAEVPFTLTAPQDAAPGGHFAVIWWSTSPPGNGGQVAIVTRAGILVYLRVSGNIIEKGHIQAFGPDARFAWNLPVNFTVDFTNDGNVALSPQGDIRITNMFGAVKAVLPVDPYGALILPGSNESFGVPWQGGGFFFGIYHATLNLTYGESNQATTQSSWFIMISPLAAALVVLIILLVFIAPPLIRRYNRWIIKRAKQQ